MASSQRLKGKWALGIEPRHFTWVLRDRLAVCERPGGYGDAHRRVRRQEEIIWTRVNGFDRIVSLIPNNANLHNYDEEEVAWIHRPFRGAEDGARYLTTLYTDLNTLTTQGFRLLMHREELGDHISGLIAGYLVWTEMVPDQPQAIVTVEQLLSRPMGPVGREIVALAGSVTPGEIDEP
ncbi:MAG: hypothetical protein ACR2P0_19940 [Acidimicrobiales bacterium]